MIHIDITKQLQLAQGYQQLHITATLPPNTITAIYGPSGAGKTTLLKIIAGLLQPERGSLMVNEATWLNTAQRISLPPQQRSVGFVFQDYALFPNMTAMQNLVYAAGKKEDKGYLNNLLRLVQMQAFENVKPAQLSGGQQQRVALIRALARKPQLLLLDEPLSALDDAMRRQLRAELNNIQQQLKVTVLLVSHDVGEVYSLASNIIHLEHGNVLFKGSPQQLFGASALSSKLQLTGEVLQVIPNGVVYILEVLAGSNVIRVTADVTEAAHLQAGDKVLLFAKAFNLAVKKLNV